MFQRAMCFQETACLPASGDGHRPRSGGAGEERVHPARGGSTGAPHGGRRSAEGRRGASRSKDLHHRGGGHPADPGVAGARPVGAGRGAAGWHDFAAPVGRPEGGWADAGKAGRADQGRYSKYVTERWSLSRSLRSTARSTFFTRGTAARVYPSCADQGEPGAAIAGGFRDWANTKEVLILPGRSVTIQLPGFHARQELAQDILLENGDHIIVP